MARAGHLVPTLALACAAASAWWAVPTEAALVLASAGLDAGRRAALALAVAGAVLAAAPFGAPLGAPLGVAPETLAELRRLLDAFGPWGAGAAALSPHPLRAVAAVAQGAEWLGVAGGVAARSAALVAAGAALARVPPAAWRRVAWGAVGACAAFVFGWALA